VTDPTGALIVGATVVITNNATSVTSRTSTNQSGLFRSEPLIPGQYSLQISHEGFESSGLSNIVLDAAARYDAQITLKIGKDTVSVTVDATAPALDTTDAAVGLTVDSRAAQELPLNGRNVLSLATLAPGVVSGVGPESDGFNDRGTQVSAIRISGGLLGANENLLDGMENLLSYLGEVAINPKADAISEFRIQSGVMSAQFGYTSGGVINIVSRSGGNGTHGAVYEYIRNDAVDALGYFTNPTIHKPELRFNQFGIAMGGPILRQRFFYFANYEQYRLVQENPSYYSLPTVQERGGDFSDVFTVTSTGGCSSSYTPIYNPIPATRTAFSGNVIPTSLFDPVALAIQQLYPLPNNTNSVYNSCTHANNFVSNTRLHSSEQQAIGRLDWQVRPRNNLFARYAYYQNVTDGGQGLGEVESGRHDNVANYSVVVGDTEVFSSNIVNELRIGGLRNDFPYIAGSANQNWPARLGLPGVPETTLPGIGNGAPAFQTQVGFRASTSLSAADDLTWVRGPQTFHLGVDTHMDQAYNNLGNNPSGYFGFSANTTANFTSSGAVVTGTGNQYATFLLGAAQTIQNTTNNGVTYRTYRYAGYVQDDWRALARLSFNVGVRYDFQKQPIEIRNRNGNFDINEANAVTGLRGNYVYAGTNGEGNNFVNENYTDFGVRLGFAWGIDRRSHTILRGGFGMYYPNISNLTFDLGAGNANGFSNLVTSYMSSNYSGFVGFLKNGLPYPAPLPLGAAGGANAFIGQTVSYSQPVAKTPLAQIAVLTVSQQLLKSMTLDVSYLQNVGIHFPVAPFNLDTLNPSYFYLGQNYLQGYITNPYAGMIPGSLGNATLTRAQLLEPYPYMYSVTTSYPHIGGYDGKFAYVSLQRRASQGTTFQVSYTFGKLFADPLYTSLSTTGGVTGPGAGSGPGAYQNPYNLRADRSVDSNDVTHRLAGQVVYPLPFGAGQRFGAMNPVVRRYLGGFQLTTTVSAQTGRPIGLTISSAPTGVIADRPNYVSGVPLYPAHRTPNNWINAAAFATPAPYSYGNTPRYISQLRGPGALSFNSSISKMTDIGTRFKLQVRLEGFNVLNHTNFYNPGTGFTPGSNGLNASSTFGQITGAYASRILQLGVRFIF